MFTLDEVKEIRSGLNHDILGSVRRSKYLVTLLNEEFTQWDQDRTKQFLGLLDHSLDEVLLKVERLHLYFKLQLKEVEKESLDMAHLFKEIIDSKQESLSKKDISVQLGNCVTVSTDATIMALVLDEIFQNAVQFSSEHSVITIEEKKETGQVSWVIRDSGLGFEPKFLPDAFKLFRKLNSLDKLEEHSGMGLALTYLGVKKLGGQVKIESSKSDGTTVILSLPL